MLIKLNFYISFCGYLTFPQILQRYLSSVLTKTLPSTNSIRWKKNFENRFKNQVCRVDQTDSQTHKPTLNLTNPFAPAGTLKTQKTFRQEIDVEIKSICVNDVIFKSISGRMVFCLVRVSFYCYFFSRNMFLMKA